LKCQIIDGKSISLCNFTRLAAVFSLMGGWTFLMYKPSVSSKMSGPKSQATNFSGGVEIVHLFC